MDDEDGSTLSGPVDLPTGALQAPVVPAMTILWHRSLDRVGEIALLQESCVEGLTRDTPAFFVPGSNIGRPIAHRIMGREAVLHYSWAEGRLEVRPGSAEIEVRIDGKPFDRARQFDLEELRRGVIVTVARAFVFCLHAIRYPVSPRSSSLGLVGLSDAIEDVRCDTTRAAGRATTVLIRGESGTGKELVARALHESGPRANGLFVAENASRFHRERADDVLFGHERGAFTGATDSQPGLFRRAHGGTLLFDEFGDLPRDAQLMLLRVLEEGIVQPLGSTRSFKVDVFVLAATNADLEAAVTAGTFNEALYHRFNTAINITVPPLRERREDVGLLLVHFLRIFLDADLQRLQDQTPDRPWLAARDVTALAMHSWRDNVRGLKGVAENLAIKAGPGAKCSTHDWIKEFLAKAAKLPPPDGRPSPASSIPASNRDLLLPALEDNDWNRGRAAEQLGISRPTFWRRLQEDPELRKVADLRMSDLLREGAAARGDVEIAAKMLGVDPGLLARRLRRRR